MKAQFPVLLAFSLVLACSSGSEEGAVTAPANPSGILLEGDPAERATRMLVDMPPSPAPASSIEAGFMRTRLEAVIHPAATVEQVNRVLGDANAAIVSMSADFPAVTLVVPPMGSLAEGEALAEELAATEAFWVVTVCTLPVEAALPQVGVEAFGFASRVDDGRISLATERAGHLDAIRMTAAKNAAGLAVGGNVPILVPDDYADVDTLESVDAQEMLTGGGAVTDPVLGNRGYIACAIMGVNPDEADFDGVHPRPVGNIDLLSLRLGGLTWSERVRVIPTFFPFEKFVLNTGVNYHGTAFGEPGTRSPVWRVLDAMRWRQLAGPLALRFVHLTSAGDTGELVGEISEAAWMSPFALSEAYPSLAGLIDLLVIDEADAILFHEIFAAMGEEPEPLGNLRVVGSSTATSHERSSFSSTGEDLRVIGENILTDCYVAGGPCSEDGATVTSTRAATAQVSGLFGWLWTLAPDHTPAELLELVDRAWFNGATPGLVDAYYATLGLDVSLAGAFVRDELLDVAGDTDDFDAAGNNRFDHHDLDVFLDAFAGGVDLRCDLNGDGQVGGDGTSLFDLDVNAPPELTTVSLVVEGEEHSYDERALTDLEILCYYAYSMLYEGDTEARAILLAECNGVPLATIFTGSLSQSGSALAHVGEEDGTQGSSSVDIAGVSFSHQASVSGLDDDSPASASSSMNYQSSLETDTYGNLVRFAAGGSSAGEFRMEQPGPGAYSTAGWGLSQATLNFSSVGGSVPYTVTLNVDGATSGDFDQYDGFVRAEVQVYDGGSMQYVVDELIETPIDSLPATVVLEGSLTDSFQSHQLRVAVRAGGRANFGQGEIPAVIESDGNCSWDVEFTLSP